MVFQTFFAPYLFHRSRNNGRDKLRSKFWREKLFRKPHLKLLGWCSVRGTNNINKLPLNKICCKTWLQSPMPTVCLRFAQPGIGGGGGGGRGGEKKKFFGLHPRKPSGDYLIDLKFGTRIYLHNTIKNAIFGLFGLALSFLEIWRHKFRLLARATILCVSIFIPGNRAYWCKNHFSLSKMVLLTQNYTSYIFQPFFNKKKIFHVCDFLYPLVWKKWLQQPLW